MPDAKLPSLDAATIAEPMNEAYESLRAALKIRLTWRSADQVFWTAVNGLLLSSRDTCRAALLLVGDERRDKEGQVDQYPAHAAILSRSLLEALGNLLALLPHKHDRAEMLVRDSYRERYHALQQHERRHPRRKGSRAIATERAKLRRLARSLRLTALEASDPKAKGGIVGWPTPDSLRNGKDSAGRPWLLPECREVFQELYEDAYGWDSRAAHQKDTALFYALQRAKGPTLEQFQLLRNVTVCRLFLYYLCVLTEIETVGTWSTVSIASLRKAWTIVVPTFDPALVVYKLRYANLVRK